MREILALLNIPFALWLIAAPWVDGDPTAIGRIGGTVAGVVLIVAAVLAMWRHGARWTLWILGIVGLAGVVFAILGSPAGAAVRIAAGIVGVIAVVLAWVSAILPAPSHIVAVNKGGSVLAEIKSLKIRDGEIAAPSVLLGSMPETIYVTPAQFWRLLGSIGPDVAAALPHLILGGRKEYTDSLTGDDSH